MKLTTLAGLALASLSLCACSSLTGPGGAAAQQSILDTAKAIAQDPNCGHTDRLAVNLGAISTGQLFLERNCPGPSGTVKTVLPPVPASTSPAPAQ
jgi:hypothetical protein